jgi:hypothetical protein
MAVRLVDLLDARTHEAGELVQLDARDDRLRRMGVAKRVRPSLRDPRRLQGRRPLAAAPGIEVEVVAALRREQEAGVEPSRCRVDRLERACGQRDGSEQREFFPTSFTSPGELDIEDDREMQLAARRATRAAAEWQLIEAQFAEAQAGS